MSANGPLHMVRVQVDAGRLVAFAHRARVGRGDEIDEGYALHALFTALFDGRSAGWERAAPKPFAVVESGRRIIDVLGYTPHDAAGLLIRVATVGDSRALGICDLETLKSKPMPSRFESGMLLRFSVRLCPVRRVASRPELRSPRAEIDVFNLACWDSAEGASPPEREVVYRDWLRDELEREGGAKLVSATLRAFRRVKQYRKRHGTGTAGGAFSEHPDVMFDGVLEVRDAERFRALLVRGLGRHRAFGYGMLLLRSVGGRP